jgi:hypothetical protein
MLNYKAWGLLGSQWRLGSFCLPQPHSWSTFLGINELNTRGFEDAADGRG